jgi:hypothetical protein
MTDPSQLEQSAAVASDIVPSKIKAVDLREELEQRSLDTSAIHQAKSGPSFQTNLVGAPPGRVYREVTGKPPSWLPRVGTGT